MEHEARYCIVRCMPDPIRGEFTNIGIVIQSEFGISYRLLEPRMRKRGLSEIPLHELQVARELLEPAFGRDTRSLRIREGGQTLTLEKNQQRYLEHYRRLFSQSIRLSESRSLTLEFDDPYLLGEHLLSLFRLLVVPAPKPKEYVVPRVKRLRPKVKHDLQLWEIYEKVEEDSIIIGTIPWRMDYTYQSNEHKVGVKLVDFGWRNAIQIVGETWGAWMDTKETLRDPRLVRAVFGNFNKQDEEHRRAMRLLTRIEALYDYDNPAERNELESILRKDLSMTPRLE